MEGILEFLKENPFWAVVILVWIFNALFGKKKEDPKKKNAQAAKSGSKISSAQAPAAPAAPGNSVREMIAEAERKMRAALEQTDVEMKRDSRSLKAKIAEEATKPPAPVASAPEAGPETFQALDGGIRAREDYDMRTRAYEYHSAVEGSAEKIYHTKFNTFQSAQGLSHDKPKTRREVEAPQIAPTEAHPLAGLLSGPDDLKRMFILKEILDKPKALR